MSQPPAYNRAYSFQSYQALNPSLPLPADQVDLEYNRVKATLDAILAALVLIQNDAGGLANGIVGRDQLSAEIEIGFDPPTPWTTSISYGNTDTVFQGTAFYRSTVAHTSGVFATDLAADRWELIADFSALTQSASLIVFDNSASGLAGATAQAAIDELASEKLDKAGGTMSGAIAMGGERITGLPTTEAASASDALSRDAGDLRYQPLDAELTALAALTAAGYGRALLETTSEATFKALVNLEAADILVAFLTVDGSGSGVDADKLRGTTPSAYGLTLIDDAAASNARTTLGLGGLAVLDDTDLVYTGSSAANVAFPVGSTVMILDTTNSDRNSSATLRLSGSGSFGFLNSGAAAALTGTWRARGSVSEGASSWTLYQRTA